MTPLRVLWICGPPGVGKSTAAWGLFTEVARRSQRCGYVDIDQVRMLYPAPSDDPGNTMITAANLEGVLTNYRSAGADRAIVSGVLLPVEVPALRAAMGDAAITWVRLHADRDQLHLRFSQRGGAIELLPDVDRHTETLAASDFADATIDTTRLSAAAVGEAIAAAASRWAQPDDPAVGDDRPVDDPPVKAPGTPPRVILLCGPRAVGASTVGWDAFQRLVRRGTCAFVDLAQVGFIGDASAAPRGRHHVRARNLAGMAGNFRRGGAGVLVAVGSVLRTEELREYVSSLAPGTLTVCRLRATPDELRARIISRATGTGGPHLAGDDLRGRPAADLHPVIQQAQAEAAVLERSEIGDIVIDTSGLRPRECADELLGAIGLR